MVLNTLTYFWIRYRPKEGWLAPLLLLGVVATLITAVLSVGWVPEDGVILPAALLGLLLGAVLARRPLQTWAAWTFIIIYGLLITTLTLGKLWPPFYLLLSDWSELRTYWLQNGALLLDRTGSWFAAVFSGGRSNETIIFAYSDGFGGMVPGSVCRMERLPAAAAFAGTDAYGFGCGHQRLLWRSAY